MATDRQGQALLRALAEESVPAEDPATAERRRRRVVEATALAIARASSERARRQQWARAGAAFASAAAIVAVAGAGAVWKARAPLRPVGTNPAVAVGDALVGTLHRSHKGAQLPDTASHLPLAAGDEVATEPGGRGEVVLADGVAITLESDTHLRLPDVAVDSAAQTREAVGLGSGLVSVRVPHLSAGHTFSITTPDAEVTVHGTSFTVEVRPGGGPAEPATRVRVTTGIVSVSSRGHEEFLTAGMDWASPIEPKSTASRGPAAAPPAGAPGSTIARTPVGTPRAPHHEAASSSSSSAALPKSRLGEENQLLAAAIADSRAGDYGGAVAQLDDLLHRFPASTLAQEAHVERFRALAHGDHPAAAREARLYLALYPDGFAREEAKGLALGW